MLIILDDPKRQRLHDLEEHQRVLLKKLTRLEEQHDLETRAEEKIRMEQRIAETNVALQRVETELLSFKQQNMFAEANRLKRVGSIREAITIWRDIQSNDPSNSVAAREIIALEKLDTQQTTANNLIKRLAARVKDIRSIFRDVVAVIQQPADTAEYEILLEQTELFLDNVLDTESFVIWWEAVTVAPSPQTTQNVDITKLAGRVQRGEMVLFLGSGIAYADDGVQEAALVRQLAQQIGYDKFNNTLGQNFIKMVASLMEPHHI